MRRNQHCYVRPYAKHTWLTPAPIPGFIQRVLNADQFEHPVLVTFPGYALVSAKQVDRTPASDPNARDYWCWVRPDDVHLAVRND